MGGGRVGGGGGGETPCQFIWYSPCVCACIVLFRHFMARLTLLGCGPPEKNPALIQQHLDVDLQQLSLCPPHLSPRLSTAAFHFLHSYINKLCMLTPNFAGYFGEGGRVLHITAHPLWHLLPLKGNEEKKGRDRGEREEERERGREKECFFFSPSA